MKIAAYLKLMRFHKPVGIVLLWLPTAWALWVANQGHPSIRLILLFLSGTILMRAAGCVVNDIADRNIDRHVKRTVSRPLTNGDISLPEALIVLIVLLTGACFIVLQLPITCFYYALFALLITVIYPFCKRFFDAPQLMLGAAFAMGIPMAYSASHVLPDHQMALLVLICILWTIAYDTIYAMVDKDDDLRIGVKSTAVLFAKFDALAILSLQILIHMLWLSFLFLSSHVYWFLLCWMLAGLWLMRLQSLVNSRDRQACFRAFTGHTIYGMFMWMALF